MRRWFRLVSMQSADDKWMKVALAEAELARSAGEVPIGACIVSESGGLLAAAGNRTIADCDPTAHAEVLALRRAASIIGNYRVIGATLYTTIEPCAMCAGALINARIAKLVFGAPDERFGAAGTLFNICDNDNLNHRITVERGVLADDCRRLMQDFFKERR